jgi:hypothetical protein
MRVHLLWRVRLQNRPGFIKRRSRNVKSSRLKITGIRPWIGRISLLGSVVMMVKLSRLLPSGLRHISHKPAKAKGSLLFK